MYTLFQALKDEVRALNPPYIGGEEPRIQITASRPFRLLIDEMLRQQTSGNDIIIGQKTFNPTDTYIIRIPFLAIFHVETADNMQGYTMKLIDYDTKD